jgi:hypothetical protein
MTVPIAILTYFVYPLLTGLAAAASGLERVTWRGGAAAVAAFLGLALMIGAHPTNLAAVGILAALGVAVCRVVICSSRARCFPAPMRAEILKEAFEYATGSKNGCGCRRRRQRTVPDEDRGGGDWSLPLQSDRPHARATEETDWPAAAARRQTRARDQTSCSIATGGVGAY